MPLLTTIIDDKSPLISYDQTWLPGSSQDDNFAIDYYLGTFQKNSVANGQATFNFNGTALWIYGANRPNHGTYAVQVDNSSSPNINGSGNNLFQQSLFSTNVSQGMHTVTLTNTGTTGQYVDIDMIVWQSEVGNTGGQLVPELVQDADPRFQYQQSAWQTASTSSNLNLNLFNNGTGHVTVTSDASVAFTFTVCVSSFVTILTLMRRIAGHAYRVIHFSPLRLTVPAGEAVTLFGTSGPSNGLYSVQLDEGQATQYNASNVYPTNYDVAIYHADNLGPGAHQIILTNLPETSGQYLTIDYAQVWTIANTSSPCVPSSNDVSQNKISSGAIAGLVIEGAAAVLAAAAAVFFYRRWKAALAIPPTTYYTPLHRSPETTTAAGIAPSLETRSNPSSVQNGTFQPLAVVQNRTPSHLDSRVVAEGAISSGLAQNEGQPPRRRPLPEAPGRSPQPAEVSAQAGLPAGDGRVSMPDAPPGYDTAVGGANV